MANEPSSMSEAQANRRWLRVEPRSAKNTSRSALLSLRPVIQATRYLAYGVRTYEIGPWDEELWWLFGPAALEAPVPWVVE